MSETCENNIDIAEWIKKCIEGPTGMLAFERYEWAIRLESNEICAASWIIRCLANPKCEGSKEVLDAIMERRKEVSKTTKG